LQEEKASGLTNRKNGKSTKKVKSLSDEFDLESSWDRNSSFELVILPRRHVTLIIIEELENKVIGNRIVCLGVSTRDIPKHIKELHQVDI
jgi:transposase-like protein